MKKSLAKAYQLKIVLQDSKPPIWRRVLVESDVPLSTLHVIIQIAMGWTDSHLHQFVVAGKFYGVPDPDNDFVEILDESDYGLDQLLRKEKSSIVYEYDFGDGWMHEVTLEKIMPTDPEAVLPVCIKAKGACPPENVGGIWGYYGFLEALADSDHPEHEEYTEWIGEGFDPDAYDLKETNKLLLKYCR